MAPARFPTMPDTRGAGHESQAQVEEGAGYATMADVLRRRARLSPDAVAFIWLRDGENETESLTFGGLDDRARGFAGFLSHRGLGGGPVVLAYTSGLDLIAALFGCFYAGAVAVVAPSTLAQTVDRVSLLAADSSATAVLTSPGLVSRLRAGLPDEIAVLCADDHAPIGNALSSLSPNRQSLAMLQYTSGSTAAPRGVMLSHANLLSNLAAMVPGSGLSAGETVVSWLPFHHDMGLLGFALFPVYAGLRCVLMPPIAFLKRPGRWIEAIDRYGAALSAGPCFAYDLCARRIGPARLGTLDLSRWRIAVCGSEAVRPDILERFGATFAPSGFRSSAFTPAYGLAECTVLATSVEPGKGLVVRSLDGPALADGRAEPPSTPARARRLASCGHPWPGHELAVVDPAHRRVQPDGSVGEIWLRGPSVSQGYWRRPGETAEIFGATLGDGDSSAVWLRTGDLGFMTDDGLIVTGRRKDMIIVRGANFDPLDLETTAMGSDPALLPNGGGAFSFDDGTSEQVVIFHEVERGVIRTLDAGSVVRKVAEAVNAVFGLSLYDVVLLRPGAMPRTTSGKVQRNLCRQYYLDRNFVGLAEVRDPILLRWRKSSASR